MIDSLFGSKTRVKLLHLFMNNPEKSYYVREITRVIGEQINSVRRELSNMTEIGVVKSNRKDNKLYYLTNTGYEYYDELRSMFSSHKIDLSKAKSTPAVKTNVDTDSSDKKDSAEKIDWRAQLCGLKGAKVVVLSNALASGKPSPNAIDLMVAGDFAKSKLNKIIESIEEAESVEVNYSTMDYENFYYRLSVRDRFVMNVLTGRCEVLVDKEKLLTKGGE